MIRTLLVDGMAGATAINPQPYASRFALNNILMAIYGIRTESMSDPVVTEVLRISREFMYVYVDGARSIRFPSLSHN